MMVQGQSAASMSQATMTVRGPSQYGKTTFVNDLMLDGGRLAVGDGSGESCTEHTVVRQTLIGPVVDGPGDQDSRLTISNEEAGRRYAQKSLTLPLASFGHRWLPCRPRLGRMLIRQQWWWPPVLTWFQILSARAKGCR